MDLASLAKGQTIDLDCPACNESFAAPADKVFQPGGVVTCTNCNTEITINHTDDSVDEIDQDLKDLQKTLENFGK